MESFAARYAKFPKPVPMNAHALKKQFQLTPTEDHDIVKSCDDYHAAAAPLPAGVNPRGLKALELWQTDVTQIGKFSWLKDSAYVADVAQWLGHSVLKEVSNAALFRLLETLWCALQDRVHPHYVLHVQSHTILPGFVAEGNARADKLANPAWVAPQPDRLVQAEASHGFFHQNAHALKKQFQLTPTEDHDIVKSCDDYHAAAAPLPAGVNPRGLKALELWQTDVTQIGKFSWLKYVHVTVDTFSSAMWALAHTGEKTRDVIAHWRQAFAVLGIPSAIKTDNGPAYTSQRVRQFLQLWGVSHKLCIPLLESRTSPWMTWDLGKRI
ncbi:hypothetical protein HGM15179_020459 [Zosterops borbonicus]|uniref:RNA-directed DNA polymerase n=1 Tax=Zosterops borbonicus TaxID=364589 RepID=A0A8K1D6W4_9PASS|nr:hypothetical protein HGM15179_020459 [Zosterops borbonicus]